MRQSKSQSVTAGGFRRDLLTFATYHGIGSRSRKNPPVGPPSGSVASHTAVSAPLRTPREALGPPMSVRTHPGHTLLTSTPSPAVALATIRVSALSAVFDTR